MTDTPRVAGIGLDRVTPQLLFRDFAPEARNIHALMQLEMGGDLTNITPTPSRCSAWACAMTGKTPGQLGIFGIRKDTTYPGLSVGTADALKGPAFDIPDLRRAGYDVALDQIFRMTERRFQASPHT